MFFFFFNENYEPLLKVLKEEFPYEEHDFGFKHSYWFFTEGGSLWSQMHFHRDHWAYFSQKFYKYVYSHDGSFFVSHEFPSSRKYILPCSRHPWNAALTIQRAWRRYKLWIASATKIQRAWLEYHYLPGGRGYEKAKSRFEDRMARLGHTTPAPLP